MIDEATRTVVESFRDKVGQEVRVGDVIAYGHAVGRSATLRIGKVLGITRVHTAYMRREANWSIRVRGVEEGRAPTLCKRDGTLQYPERIVKLAVVPEAIAKLLESIT